MQEPALPKNEADRIALLHSLNILDTPRDERYDRYTRMSARIFNTPIAVISLVDRYRQWFKSANGLNAQETPRNISFCGHAILGSDVFEVRNAHRDPRFCDNPLVMDQPNIRFYAGAPLESPDGHKLGTLCIIDRVPRKLSDEEKVMLKNLAKMVVAEMMNSVDTETGLANRMALETAGTECFEKPAGNLHFSLHLFEIDGSVDPSINPDSRLPAGETFARLLASFYPNADSIAYLGDNRFCVLLHADSKFDERRAISHLTATAKVALCGDDHRANFSAFVGVIEYNAERHTSFNDVMLDIDTMFLGHERQPKSRVRRINPFFNVLARLRGDVH